MRLQFSLLLMLSAALVLASCGGDKKETAPKVTTAKAEVQKDLKKTKAAKGPIDQKGVPFKKLDFSRMPKDFKEQIALVRASQKWDSRKKARNKSAGKGEDPRKALELKMTRETLEEAYTAGCDFLVNWQLPEGNFNYMYDWLEGTWVKDDHQVRQAGSLWGLGTCYRYKPSEKYKKALDKGIDYWATHTTDGPVEGAMMMKYGDDRWLHSGTVALVALGIIEYLATDAPMEEARRKELDERLDGYLAFLQYMQRKNGHIADRYDVKAGKRRERSSPYYDGESLLAMTKAARQLDKKSLVPTIERAARSMAETYTIKAWAKSRDSNDTKGFFQWGSMSFAEYYQAEWKDHEFFADVSQSLGYWMIHTHRTLSRRRNHAYAMEGLAANWLIANKRGDIAAQTDLLFVLDRSMYKLSGWQIGGPLAKNNKFLVKKNNTDPMTQGGVMNAASPSGADVKKDVSHQLRIDVTQHQMHAVTMSLEDVYVDL